MNVAKKEMVIRFWEIGPIHFLLFRVDIVGESDPPAFTLQRQSHETNARKEFGKGLLRCWLKMISHAQCLGGTCAFGNPARKTSENPFNNPSWLPELVPPNP